MAVRLAREAGAAIEAIRASGFVAHLKDDQSPVTAADLAADRLIRSSLEAAFPADAVFAEESGGAHERRERTWVVDPLDGTEAFVDGTVRGYAVQIGLLVDERPVLGVVYEPRYDRLFWAVAGGGAFLAEAGATHGPLRVSARDRLADMPLLTSSTIPAPLHARLLAVGLPDAGHLRSVGVKVGELVTGQADVYVSHHPVAFWDTCAPLVILEEAGGVATHLTGAPLTYPLDARRHGHPGPFIASNGRRHAELCAAFAAHWEG